MEVNFEEKGSVGKESVLDMFNLEHRPFMDARPLARTPELNEPGGGEEHGERRWK